jgi:NAD dependent epimerase/dehydratase family enzyme
MGSGRQFVSWIHEEDFCRAVEWILDRQEMDGAINIAAPNPLTNAEMMKAFRSICGIPIGLPAARWMLETGAFVLRTETELLLKSRRVVPGGLLRSGFEFRFASMGLALADLEKRVGGAA